MPYIGNDIRANEDYKTIDDISVVLMVVPLHLHLQV